MRAPTLFPSAQPTAIPTFMVQTGVPQSVQPTISPSPDEALSDRFYVTIALFITAIVVCCTCSRGFRRRRNEHYGKVGEYSDMGIELGFKDRSQMNDLLEPIETSRDLDLI